jgi:hypothetical protein
MKLDFLKSDKTDASQSATLKAEETMDIIKSFRKKVDELDKVPRRKTAKKTATEDKANAVAPETPNSDTPESDPKV